MIKYIALLITGLSLHGANIHGWNVEIRGGAPSKRTQAIKFLNHDLNLISKKLPKKALKVLYKTKIVIGGLPNQQGWAVTDGITNEIRFKNVFWFVAGRSAYPDVMWHEMAHAYHGEVLDHDLKPFNEAFKRHKERYERLGRKALPLKPQNSPVEYLQYANTNGYEYFAEMSTVFFGAHRSWARLDPEVEAIFESAWHGEDIPTLNVTSKKEARISLRLNKPIFSYKTNPY